jgi:para-aminobenzoate synthetase
MTGAPKLRSVDILNDVELGQSRGPYSGSLGYISLNGSMDMNIVIRTALVTPNSVNKEQDSISWDVAIGAGGAITALSESQDEFEEMLLKARAIRNSVEQWNNGGVI